ncbi:MAG: hypothetical protein M1834_006458 [Cirrosporium novae-zelandiae]|nr:MAG: hypothetical protein M1834_006458 [Cirrosporium novae-zelandiae]
MDEPYNPNPDEVAGYGQEPSQYYQSHNSLSEPFPNHFYEDLNESSLPTTSGQNDYSHTIAAWQHHQQQQQQPLQYGNQNYPTPFLPSAPDASRFNNLNGQWFTQNVGNHIASQPFGASALGYNPNLLTNQQNAHLNTTTPYAVPYDNFPPTIAPHALQASYGPEVPAPNNQPSSSTQTAQNPPERYGSLTSQRSDTSSLPRSLATKPPGDPHDRRFIQNDIVTLEAVTNSSKCASFLTISKSQFLFATSKNQIPKVAVRKSKKEVEALLGGQKALGRKKVKLSSMKRALQAGDSASNFNSRKVKSDFSSRMSTQGQVTSESPSTSTSEEEDDDSSSYVSSSDEENEELEIMAEPFPLSSTRPSDPIAGTEYDAVRIIWSPRNKQVSEEMIRNTLASYGQFIVGLREKLRTDTNTLKEAEQAKQGAKISDLKRKTDLQRNKIDIALSAATEYGHAEYLSRLAQHKQLMAALQQLLIDRYQEKDVNSGLTLHILRLMTNFTDLDRDTLERFKLDKIIRLITKKGASKAREFAQKVLDNADTRSKKGDSPSSTTKASDNKGVYITPSQISSSARQTVVSNALKRPREGDSGQLPPQKKAIPSANKAVTSQASKTNGTALKRPSPAVDSKTGSGSSISASSKVKINHISAKPSSLIVGLTSASKKPGTSNAEKAAKAAATKSPGQHEVKKASTPKPVFSFTQMLANINKPKSPPPEEKTKVVAPPETEEERKKRLRKEERRKLRVTFKPDDSLTEVRIFTHDPDEEIGHEDSMMRDIDDIGGEGRMHKLHIDKDISDEEEEAGLGPREEEFKPWQDPSPIDFSRIAEQLNINYFKRGGSKEPESEERKSQAEREATKLMEVYTSRADIPPSPREPQDCYSPPPAETPSFGNIEFGWLKERENGSIEKYGHFPLGSHQTSVMPPAISQSLPQATSHAVPQFDITALARLLAPQQQPTPQLPIQQQPAAPSQLEKVFAMFSNTQSQPQVQPPPQPNPVASSFNLAGILSSLNSQVQVPVPPQPQSQPQFNFTQPPTLQDILSQFQQPGMQQPMYNGYQSQHQGSNENDRKRQRGSGNGQDYDDYNNGDHGYGKRAKASNGKKGYRKIRCKWFAQGNCRYGDECTYLHE